MCLILTSMVTYMAQLLFKVCLANVNPRLGSRSNFAGQDVSLVVVIMSGKSFDLAGLILKNMMVVYESHTNTGLPYGLLLTRVFDWYGVGFRDDDKEIAKEFLDFKSL